MISNTDSGFALLLGAIVLAVLKCGGGRDYNPGFTRGI
jgi:hypothetical protein